MTPVWNRRIAERRTEAVHVFSAIAGLNVVQADLEGLIFLLIIAGSVISRILKARKDFNQARPAEANEKGPFTGSGSDADPAADLRRFFEELSGADTSGRPPPPVPPPVPPAAALPRDTRSFTKTPEARAHYTQARPVAKRTSRKTVQVPGGKIPVTKDKLIEKTAGKVVKIQVGNQKTSHSGIMRMLKQRNTVRTAVVLREILGPPHALQHPGQPGATV